MVVVVVLMVLAAAGSAAGDCEKSRRISRDNAECLSGQWKNRSWPKKSTVKAVNECPEWGKVVAKIDIKDAADFTWHLADGSERSKKGFFRVRDVTCCSDLSDLCNRTDAVTDQGCLARYDPAAVVDIGAGGLGAGVVGRACPESLETRAVGYEI